MANTLKEARAELALANRIVANEGVIDAFGHVSMRHPDNPNRYLLSRSRAPELVTPDDFIEYDLDSQPVRDPGVGQYSERVIHGEIYKARPEVMSVCHHHCPAFMPLLATGTDYVPIFHLGAVGGIKPPYWDQHDEFGDTNMLVVKPEEGASLARALGSHWMVLMKRHGVTVAGTSVRDCVFRCDLFGPQCRVPGARHDHRQQHRLAVAGRSGTGRPDQPQDHGPHALVGILVDAGGQSRRACRRRPRSPHRLRQSRAGRVKCGGAEIWAFPVGGTRC